MKALERVERLTTRGKLETLLDWSPGYISKMIARRKKVEHRTAVFFDLIAADPGRLSRVLEELEDDSSREHNLAGGTRFENLFVSPSCLSERHFLADNRTQGAICESGKQACVDIRFLGRGDGPQGEGVD